MSLLLDALKKAALEKQRRENPNDIKMPAPTSPLLQVEPLALEEELDFNLDELEIGKEIAIEIDEEMQTSPVTGFLKKQAIENSQVHNVELINKAPEQKPIELSPAPSSPPTQPAPPFIPIAPPSTPIAQPPIQPAPPVNINIPEQDSSVEIRKIVQEFDVTSGKEALLQLLGRSKKAANQVRKRMIMISAALIVTSVTLVLGYFFLLRGSAVALVAPTANLPASPSPQMSPATEALGEAPSELETDTQILGASPAVVSHQQVAQLIDEAGNKNELGNKNKNETLSENINSVKTKRKSALSPKNMLPTNDDMNRSESLPANKQLAIISHQSALNDPVGDAIQRGYQAYQNGDLKLADAAYHEALEQDANNRDALLGVAAIAAREGRQQDALGFYQRRLARAPKDDYAQAGVVALSSTSEANPELDAELSRLLREYPEASHLHFLRGSLLAARQQWAAAQLAFFEAWQRDNKNPELAFNLAVALDHLNQPKEAARFYQQAINMSNSRPVNFSVDDVRRRLEAIEVKTP
jgi:tetratricopeptide (TPR) repeat protein